MPETAKITIAREDQGDITIVSFTECLGEEGKGHLDFKNTVTLRTFLHNLKKIGRRHIIIDMGIITKICSYAVGVFVALVQGLREMSGDLKFCNLQQRVRDTFESTGAIHVVEILNSKREAVSAFQKGEEKADEN